MALPSPPSEWGEVDNTFGLYYWCEFDWTPLLDGAEFRGSDTVIPGSPGQYVNPRTIDETEYICPGYVFADRTFDGDDLAGDFDECRENLRALMAFWRGYIGSPTSPYSPLRTFTLHGVTTDWEASVIIGRRLSLGAVVESEQSPLCLKATARIVVPSGEFVAVGP